MLTVKSYSNLRWMAVCAALLIASLLAACGAPAAAPTPAPEVVAEAVGPTILAEGAPVHPAGNLAFGPDGNLYVATWIGREIVVLDPNNGEILERFGPEDGIEFPGDLVFGPDDSLYWAIWTSSAGQGIGRMSPDGVVSSQPLPRATWPLTFSDDDRLFAGQIFLNLVFAKDTVVKKPIDRKLDLYTPADSGDWPILLFLPGSGHSISTQSRLAQAIAECGVMVFVVSYPSPDPDFLVLRRDKI